MDMMEISVRTCSWIGLVVGLFLTSFGSTGCFFLLLLAVAFLLGVSIMLYVYGSQNLALWNDRSLGDIQRSSNHGLALLVKGVLTNKPPMVVDRPMTGSSAMDDILHELLQYISRDYITSWYQKISENGEFQNEIRQTLEHVIVTFSDRRLVDDFASHIRLYRQTLVRVLDNKKDDTKAALDMESIFFDLELEMEKTICRDQICQSRDYERQYLREVSEVLMFLLLPADDFHNKHLRYIFREILVGSILLPTIDLFCDPDFINQTMSWLCKETMLHSDSLLTILRTSDSIDELQAVKEKLDLDIARQRSQDSGGDCDTVIKKQLNSLIFVKSVCEARMWLLQDGSDDLTLPNSDLNIDRLLSGTQSICSLSINVVLNNATALSYFIEFMTSIGEQAYLFFYLTVEGYRVSAEQRLCTAIMLKKNPEQSDIDTLCEGALGIYNQYLSEKASPRLKFDDHLLKTLGGKIAKGYVTDTIFDELQKKVYCMLQQDVRFFPAFKKSVLYVKALLELGLLTETPSISKSESDEGNLCLASHVTSDVDSTSLKELTEEYSVDCLTFSISCAPEPTIRTDIYANNFGSISTDTTSSVDSIKEVANIEKSILVTADNIDESNTSVMTTDKIDASVDKTTNEDACGDTRNNTNSCLETKTKTDAFASTLNEVLTDTADKTDACLRLTDNAYTTMLTVNGEITSSQTNCHSFPDTPDDIESFKFAASDFDQPSDISDNIDVLLDSTDIFTLSASMANAGVCRDHGRAYAIYVVTVVKTLYDGTAVTWDVYRRYSDFQEFHMLLHQKYESFDLPLPKKPMLEDISEDMLEQHRLDLSMYLQLLLDPRIVGSHDGLIQDVFKFLKHLHWERGEERKSGLERKMDLLVNPFRTSVRSVSNLVRSMPENIADSVARVSDGFRSIPGNMINGVGKMLNGRMYAPTTIKVEEHSKKVGAALDLQESDYNSIPLQIMLLLMDEVFDLNSSNQWLRRQIISLLQQIIKHMYGDSINRKIIEHVEYLASCEQIVDYLQQLRDLFWPNGCLAEAREARDFQTRMRSRVVCKAKLYGSLSEELKHLIGSEKTQQGVTLVFNMFQHQTLNRRLVYVILEGLLETLFQDSKLNETFKKIHSSSHRVQNLQR